MFLTNNEHKFYLKAKGEKTAEAFEGDFTTKCILNQQEQVEVALRTDRYNGGSKTISPTHALINRTVAELEVRMIKAPTWWTDSDSGRLLYDTNILFDVFTETMKGEKVWADRLKGEVENAEKDAEKSPAKDKKAKA